MSIESVMPSNHLILCCPLLLLPSIFLSIRVFSTESVLHIRWPKYWSFSFSITPSNEHSGLIYFRMDWLDLSRVFSNTTVQKHQFFGAQFSFFFFFFISWRLITLQHCSGFCHTLILVILVIHWQESAMVLHVFPIPIPPPTSLSARSLWDSPTLTSIHDHWKNHSLD